MVDTIQHPLVTMEVTTEAATLRTLGALGVRKAVVVPVALNTKTLEGAEDPTTTITVAATTATPMDIPAGTTDILVDTTARVPGEIPVSVPLMGGTIITQPA